MSDDGVLRSTYYRWKRRWQIEALRVRERRRPPMPNEIGPHLERRIVALSLAHPGFVTALIRALDGYLAYHNTDGAHTGRHTQGRVPTEIVHGARKIRTAR